MIFRTTSFQTSELDSNSGSDSVSGSDFSLSDSFSTVFPSFGSDSEWSANPKDRSADFFSLIEAVSPKDGSDISVNHLQTIRQVDY